MWTNTPPDRLIYNERTGDIKLEYLPTANHGSSYKSMWRLDIKRIHWKCGNSCGKCCRGGRAWRTYYLSDLDAEHIDRLIASNTAKLTRTWRGLHVEAVLVQKQQGDSRYERETLRVPIYTVESSEQ